MEKLFKIFMLTSVMAISMQKGYSQIKFGIKAGASLTHANYKQNASAENRRVAFNAGVLGEMSLKEKLFLRPELLYSLKGWSHNGLIKAGKMNLHYVNLPLLVGYKPTAKLSLLAGPELAFLVNGKAKSKFPLTSTYQSFQKLEGAVSLGAAYLIHPQIGVEFRYTHGLTPLSKAGDKESYNQSRDGYNRAFQVGLFYMLTKKASCRQLNKGGKMRRKSKERILIS